MKSLITTVLFFTLFGFGAFSQSVFVPGGAPQDVLFRGYQNVIHVKDNEGLNRIFNVGAENADITILHANDGSTNEGRYLIHPSVGREIKIIVSDAEGNEIAQQDYKVNPLPDCDLQFDTKNGQFSTDVSKMILVDPAFGYFDKTFEFLDWSVEIQGAEVESGRGNVLSTEAMSAISQLAPGETFEVKVAIIDIDQVTRLRTIQGIR